MAPEAVARLSQAQAAAQRLGHGYVRRRVVAAPMHGELLAARSAGARKQHRFALTALALKQLEHGLVVQEGVVIVHLDRVAAVVPGDVAHRYALAKVGLEAVHAHVQ